jgi:hypothetical protein
VKKCSQIIEAAWFANKVFVSNKETRQYWRASCLSFYFYSTGFREITRQGDDDLNGWNKWI